MVGVGGSRAPFSPRVIYHRTLLASDAVCWTASAASATVRSFLKYRPGAAHEGIESSA
jgi:hypothetical protein